MLHIVSRYPQTKLKGSVQWLYSDDFDIAVQRLKTRGSRMHTITTTTTTTTTTTELSTVRRQMELDGCIVWNAHNTVLGEEERLIYIIPVYYVKTGRYGKPSNIIISLQWKKFHL